MNSAPTSREKGDEPRRAVITGAAGFAGSHLAECLLERGWEVFGTDRPGISRNNFESLGRAFKFHEFDVLDSRGVETLLDLARPDVVFHLAAVAYVPYADHYPSLVFDINAKAVLALADSLFRLAPSARLVLVSSSQVYGRVEAERMPLGEDCPVAPVNIYGLSKLCAEEIVRSWQRVGRLDGVIVRPFNHFGPRQRPEFVISDWARQIARIELGEVAPVLRVGNLEAARDFTGVRDMVKAYLRAAEKGKSGEVYNVCSGRAHPVGEILELLLGMSRVPIEVKEDTRRLRSGEIPLVVGDCSRFRRDTDWEPEQSLGEGLEKTLQYWRRRLARS